MTDSIKITSLNSIGANIAYTTLIPVVNMAGTPVTQKATAQLLGNLILLGAGGSYFPQAAQATLAQTVTNAAQPNITSVGTLTSLAVTGNITAGNVNGGNIIVANFYYGDGGFLTNVTANGSYSNSNVANYLPTFTGNVGAGNVNVTGTVYANGLSSTGLASLTTLNVSTTANLGAVGNVKITGGSAGQKLTTDGAGNLSWTNDANSSYSNNNVANYLPTFAGNLGANNLVGLANANLTVYSNAGAHSFTFADDGTFYSPDNVVVGGSRFSVGPGANTLSGELEGAVLVASSNSIAFIQGVIENVSDNGSADWVAQGHLGNDNGGYVNLGFNSSGHADANHTISGPGDGYVIVDGYANGQAPLPTGGNLVLATSSQGLTKDIVFATGGFLANNEFARISHANNALELSRANSNINLSGGGGIIGSGNLKLQPDSANANAYLDIYLTGGPDIHIAGNGETVILGTDDFANVAVNVDGNVSVQANAGTPYTWKFDSTGNLTLPGSIITPNGANAAGGPGTAGAPLTLTAGTGGIAATGFNAGAGGDLTITAGDAGSNIGNQSWGEVGGDLVLRGGNATGPYVGGNVAIYSGAGPTTPGAISLYTGANQWTFDATGNLTVPGSLINDTSIVLSAPAVFNICTIATAGSGYNTGSSLKATTGGSGSGMTVGIGYGLSNQLTSVSVVNPGTGYVNGDVITVSEGTGGTFVLTKYNQSANQTNNNTIQTDFTFANSTVTLPIYGEMATDYSMTLTTNLANAGNTSSWTFGTDGNLTIPGTSGGFIKTASNASIGIAAMDNGTNNPAQLLSINVGNSNATSIISAYATNATIQTNASGNINTWAFDNAGNLTLPANTFAINYANGTQVSLGVGSVTWAQLGNKDGTSGPTLIALGQNAGLDGQGSAAIAIGKNAGQGGQGAASITIGEDAGGNTTQGANAVAIGKSAGFDAQGIGAVAIGSGAGQTIQGTSAIAIGTNAGITNQGNNSIILNATGANLNQTTANTFTVSPVRNDTSNIAEVMFYNATSKEVTYGNTISVAGNANVGNLGTATAIITTGNITTINSGLLQNGNSNITLTANGNVSIQAAGSTVELVVTSTGANITGTANITGNANVGNIGANNGVFTGNISGNTNGFAIGYLNIPQVAAANATLALTDAGKHYYSTSAGNFTLTVPNNTTTSFATGTAISIVVQSAGNVLVNAASGVTLYMAGNSTAANRVVSNYGMATLLKVATDTWMINGTGVA